MVTATQQQHTQPSRARQVVVPKPDPYEATPQAVEPLMKTLEAIGRGRLAHNVRTHAQRLYFVDRCAEGHLTARPSSDGCRLCTWCRWRRLERWVGSMLEFVAEASEGFVPETPFPLDVKAAKRAIGGPVLKHGAAAVFDFVPIENGRWRLVVVVVGHGASTLFPELVAGMQALGGGLVSTRSFSTTDVGNTHDRVLPRLTDFTDKPNQLQQHLDARFGQQVIRRRQPRKQPAEASSNGAAFLEPEEAAAAFAAILKRDGPQAEENMDDVGGGATIPPLAPFDSASANGSANGAQIRRVPPGLDEEDASMPPPGWILASTNPNDALRAGMPCEICRRPTERLGSDRLSRARLYRVNGTGPREIDARDVFDPTGELRSRSPK